MLSRPPERVPGRGPGASSAPGPAGGPRVDSEYLAGLDAFRQRRRAVFYPKADLPESPAPAGEVDEEERQGRIAAACRLALGQDVTSVLPLTEQGTFHRLYRAVCADGSAVVVRVHAGG